MSDIAKADKNFEVKTKIDKDDIKFYSVEEEPFKVYGVFKENGKYRRIPEKLAVQVSDGVYQLHANTAGGRVKFKTNSTYVAIHVEMDGLGKMPHFAFTGSIGFDLYVDNHYKKTFVPPFDIEDGYESLVGFADSELRDITINFPLYSNVKNLYIGIEENAVLQEGTPYVNTKPIVFYGSSITQGGCASRPGMSYQSLLSRKFNYDFINLGFSGNGKAEDIIVDYMKKLDMSVFVSDYDYNAPTVEHLENTHEKMYKAIREANPTLPIILMSRPKFILNDEEKIRRSIIETTYKNAIASGDKNIYFVDGETLTSLCKDEGTVDWTHPTDFGFVSMAEALVDVFEKIDVI